MQCPFWQPRWAGSRIVRIRLVLHSDHVCLGLFTRSQLPANYLDKYKDVLNNICSTIVLFPLVLVIVDVISAQSNQSHRACSVLNEPLRWIHMGNEVPLLCGTVHITAAGCKLSLLISKQKELKSLIQKFSSHVLVIHHSAFVITARHSDSDPDTL